MKKIDILNQRKGENWILVNGKTQRVEEIKVTGPIMNEAITEVKVIEKVKHKKKYTKKK